MSASSNPLSRLPFGALAAAAVAAVALAMAVPAGVATGQEGGIFWGRAPAITDFIQKEPIQGAPPTDDMEVRFAYDGGAFYVGARMWARNVRGIQAPLGRRDVSDQAEYILIALDTFLDRRTAFVLGVRIGAASGPFFFIPSGKRCPAMTRSPFW